MSAPSPKLFVGNLKFQTDSDALAAAFAPYGEITEAKVVTDRDTGRSRGFGFVRFASVDDAKQAHAAMQGVELDGRTINVDFSEDRPAPERGARGGYGGRGRR